MGLNLFLFGVHAACMLMFLLMSFRADEDGRPWLSLFNVVFFAHSAAWALYYAAQVMR
jgi:hypothetical protein